MKIIWYFLSDPHYYIMITFMWQRYIIVTGTAFMAEVEPETKATVCTFL